MNIYQKRLNKVREFATKVKELYDTGKYQLQYDEEMCGDATIVVDETTQYFGIKLQCGKNAVHYMLYDGNLNFDHGAYTPIAETIKMLRDSIKLFELKPVKL